VQQLKEENTELRKLTTDEDKTLLLWKAWLREDFGVEFISPRTPALEVGALTKQCEALQAQWRS